MYDAQPTATKTTILQAVATDMAEATGFPKTSDIAQTIGVLKTSVKATKKRSPDSDSDKSQGSKGSARLFRYNQRCGKEILTLVPATKVNNNTPAYQQCHKQQPLA